MFQREVRFNKERYLAPSWDEMGKLCFTLAKQILEQGQTYDRLVTLAKGGWTWSRTMADYLGIEKIGSIQLQFYQGISKTAEKPILVQSLPVSVNGESLLLFDDVDDTGKSLKVAREYLDMCGARKITVATLFHKPWSKINPDFTGVSTQAWVVFPHEIKEAVLLLNSKWQLQGIIPKERERRFSEIGLDPEEVSYFLNLPNSQQG